MFASRRFSGLLFISFLGIGIAIATLRPAPAFAACATPTANAGALEWFTADTKFKYCDGTNWIVIGSAGLWTLNGTDIHYAHG